MPIDDERIRELLRVIAATAPEEIDCEQFLVRAARCLDGLRPDDPIPPEFHDVARHLRICGECREEYEALSAILHARTPPRCA